MSGDRGDGRGVRLDGVCGEVVLQPWDGELTVGERFFDGLLRAVCSSVVSEFSPEPVQTLVEQGFGGAEGTPEGLDSSVMGRLYDSGVGAEQQSPMSCGGQRLGR